MLPFYPTDLPPPLRQGYQVARGDSRFSFTTDAGPPLVRSRFSAVVDVVSWSTQLDRAQLGRFERFYFEETRKGAKPFLMPDPGTDGWGLLTDEGEPLLTDGGVPILLAETWIVSFGLRLPTIQPHDIYWTVSFDLTVYP